MLILKSVKSYKDIKLNDDTYIHVCKQNGLFIPPTTNKEYAVISVKNNDDIKYILSLKNHITSIDTWIKDIESKNEKGCIKYNMLSNEKIPSQNITYYSYEDEKSNDSKLQSTELKYYNDKQDIGLNDRSLIVCSRNADPNKLDSNVKYVVYQGSLFTEQDLIKRLRENNYKKVPITRRKSLKLGELIRICESKNINLLYYKI